MNSLARCALLVFTVLSGTHAYAAVRLASPFTSHMVLQREMKVPVWGTADAGEEVAVEFDGQKKRTQASADGSWRIELDPLAASDQGRTLTVTGSKTPEPLRLDDVLVGEVWLASGQSNMDFTVAKTEKYYFAGVINEAEEVAAANHPRLRMFTGQWKKSYAPEKEVGGTWKICTPENVREFSAVGYFFARALQREIKVPIGIVTLTFGASAAQAWIRREAITANPRLKPTLDKFDEEVKNYVPPTEEELKPWREAVAAANAQGKRGPRQPKPDPVQDQHNPTVMYNGMIAPVVPYAIRGVIWYQGESITGPRELFPIWNETLIKDWRTLWGRDHAEVPPLPFYFCQLAAHNANSNSPEVRALQAKALALPHTGMAVTIDVGDPKDVHPHNKAPVGERLAVIALANVYERDVEYSGPEYDSAAVEGNAIRVRFTHVGGRLVARDGPLKTFEVAGPDGKFVPAEAKIEGDTVIVSAVEVPTPTAARYAWSNYPEGCNFYNAAGLPAAPFRTDLATP